MGHIFQKTNVLITREAMLLCSHVNITRATTQPLFASGLQLHN